MDVGPKRARTETHIGFVVTGRTAVGAGGGRRRTCQFPDTYPLYAVGGRLPRNVFLSASASHLKAFLAQCLAVERIQTRGWPTKGKCKGQVSDSLSRSSKGTPKDAFISSSTVVRACSKVRAVLSKRLLRIDCYLMP